MSPPQPSGGEDGGKKAIFYESVEAGPIQMHVSRVSQHPVRTVSLEGAAARLRPWAETVGQFLIDTPPLYTVTAAVVAGDAIGNYGLTAPLWVAGVLAAIAA